MTLPVTFADTMPDVATYWAPGIPDEFGSMDFSAVVPVVIACRWQNKTELFRDAKGNEVMSSAIVYPDRELALQGYLIEGNAGTETSADPRVAGAREVRSCQASPSLRGDEVCLKVYL